MAEAADQVVVDHAGGLHEGVADGGADEAEGAALEVLVDGVRERGAGGGSQAVELEEAIRCYSRAVEILPAAAPAWNNLGHVWSRLGNQERALGCFKEAIRLEEEQAAYYLNRALAYARLGSADEVFPVG